MSIIIDSTEKRSTERRGEGSFFSALIIPNSINGRTVKRGHILRRLDSFGM